MKRFILLFLTLSSLNCANRNNDVELWVTEVVNKTLNPTCNFSLSNEWRIRHDISQLYFIYLQGVMNVNLSDTISIGPGYRQIWHLDSQDHFRLSYEPLLNLFIHKGQLFQVRHRISYLMREKEKNLWQYRIRLRLSTEKFTYNPFFSNEAFVFSHYGFTQNRTMVGINVPFSSGANADFSYMLRFTKSDGTWTHQHVFGTWFNFLF